MGIDLKLTLSKPIIEDDRDETFDLDISDGKMNVEGIDFLYELYPELSRVANEAINYINSDNFVSQKNFELDYSYNFSNGGLINVTPKLPLKYGEIYILIGTVESFVSESENVKLYMLKTNLDIVNGDDDFLRIYVITDKHMSLKINSKYFISAYIRTILPYKMYFAASKVSLIDDNGTDLETKEKYDKVFKLMSVNNDGRLVSLMEKKDVDKKVKEKIANQDFSFFQIFEQLKY